MLSLIFAIAASFTISVMVKLNEIKGINSQVVLASNYLIASLLGWAFALGNGVQRISPVTWQLGLVGGILWPITFYLLMWGVRHYGISLAGSVSRLSLSVPVLFALLFLGERLTVNTGIGIAGVFAAFFLLSPIKTEAAKPLDRQALWYFPVLVLCFGIVDFWLNLFNTIGPGEERFLFIVLIFTISSVIAWGSVLWRKVSVTQHAVVRGLLVGVPNFFSTYFLMMSLTTPLFAERSAVVYALYSVMGVTLAFVAGALVWDEKVTRANILGVLVAIGAIILLNLG